MAERFISVDGNEAAAGIAYLTNDFIAIYPITPASPMGELSDYWSHQGRRNIFGNVPDVIEMQSEAGAAAAVHGALQTGALATTFTASQGLLLMIPEMFKIAGQLLPTVFHISARSIATHALSIFGDQSDVMAVRSTGWAMLASNSVEEAQDFALIAQSATMASSVPFIHFFDGFRTSHEVNKIRALDEADVRFMVDEAHVQRHRRQALNPDHPVLRGSSQNPDVYFQAREATNRFYASVPVIVQAAMDRFGDRVGRQYRIFDYVGAPDARRIVVLMGSGAGAVEEAVEQLVQQREKVGLVKVRLYRPFDGEAFRAAIPSTVERVAVLDRTKEPGGLGEPLFLDVTTALAEAAGAGLNGRPYPAAQVTGGRYGLSSKEFTPAMAKAVFAELERYSPKRRFTIGIHDDITHLSLQWDPASSGEPDSVTRAVFYGVGSDGTVGATKNTVKIIGESTALFAQGYFVYDSKKSGTVTASHLRISPRPIRSTYLIDKANFVGCHQFDLLERLDVLGIAATRGTFLLNSRCDATEVWNYLPDEVQRQIIEKQLRFYVVDAYEVARQAGLGSRISTAMQACFFALVGVLPRERAVECLKTAVKKSFSRRGALVVERNEQAIDSALLGLHEVRVPVEPTSQTTRLPALAVSGDDFVDHVMSEIAAGRGDQVPVSRIPFNGVFPTGTSRYEKRSIAAELPRWDPSICIDCGLCAWVCPHAAMRMKVFPATALEGAPDGFQAKPFGDKELTDHYLAIQVAPDDCTACGVCIDVCSATSKVLPNHKAMRMRPKSERLGVDRANFDFFLRLPQLDRTKVKTDTVKGSQLLQPLFEYSGACAGCGETPYLRLLSQLFGDRAVIGNATGCSSIYGGNLPTTPWAKNETGQGPAWCNPLFEDVAEFALGMRAAIDHQWRYAHTLLRQLSGRLGDDFVTALIDAPQSNEKEIHEQRERVRVLKSRLTNDLDPLAMNLAVVADDLIRRSVWGIGGDGWAYDIGFGGLDHVLTSGRDVNLLVLDTGVYSNTGGQASKSTPRGAVAKFASTGKLARRKDLGMLAVAYGNVYVAQVAMAANPLQTLRAFHEAESYRGVSLILAYCQCIAHGIDMAKGMSHQKEVVQSGLWPLYRYDPRLAHAGGHAFRLDSRKPTLPFAELAQRETRFAMAMDDDPKRASRLFHAAQKDIDDQWHYYEQMAAIDREIRDDES
jgi:pyruvate-ferredoxin/flavodoxin oxidoreductase